MHYQTRQLSTIKPLAQLTHRWPQRYPFALITTSSQSEHHQANGRYDIVLACPQQTLQLNADFTLTGVEDCHQDDDFLSSFDRWFKDEQFEGQQLDKVNSSLPFTGGWFIYCAYELAQQIEPCLTLPALDKDQPVALAVRIPAAIILDHHEQTAWLVAEDDYSDCLEQMENDYQALSAAPEEVSAVPCDHVQEADEHIYLQQVERLKQYIVDGDIFQANLSRPWQLHIDPACTDQNIFDMLAQSNPSTFACQLNIAGSTVISSSPERLIKVKDRQIETRPIAGTRPRSDDSRQDVSLSDELLAHPKEQAEHIMLIDLERNDLGRICRPGSIHVNELLTLESWQHVHHIVSNIQGELREDILPGEVIRAVFPGGTITGCPKVHCMQLLAEQEQQSRGCYTGSAGYINRDGSMDINILIRTLWRDGDRVSFRAGGGIVADSDPQAELAETRAKAKGLLRAFEL